MSQQEEGITKVLSQQKNTFYQFTSQLVNNEFNIKLYYFLILIQHLQIIGYQCHQVFDYKGLGVNVFRKITQFINPEHFLKHSQLMNYIIPIGFVYVMIHIGFMTYSYYLHRQNTTKKDHIQPNRSTSLVIAHYLTILLTTVLTTPIFLPSLLVFYCHQGSPYHPQRSCYNTYHLFLILISIINILWVVAINIYYFLFYYTRNPFLYKNFLAVSSSLWNVLKFTVKVVPAGYLIFDEILEFNILFVFGIAAGLIGYTAISRVLYPYTRYSEHIQCTMISIQIISISISGLFILQAFFTEQQGTNITFITSFIISVPLAILAYDSILKRKQATLLTINDFTKDNTQNIEQLLSYLIVQLEDQQRQEKLKRFFKIVKLHNDKCENASCACWQYLKKYQQDQTYYLSKELLYRIFVQIIDKTVENNKKAYSLLLLKSYIEYYKLDNSIKGAFIISKIMRQKISKFEEYLIAGFLYQVSKSFEDSTNMETYRIFSQHLIRFQKEAIRLAESYEQFWHQISEQNTSLLKVMNLLKQALKSKKIIDQEYQTLYSIYPSNVRITQIYKELYKQILINYEQFIKYHGIYKENLEEREEPKLMRASKQLNFGPNQDLIVINTSVNVINDIFHGGCEIISVTNNVYKILGYSSQDLIGKNINRFLPKLYTEFHDEIIENYLNKPTAQQKPRQLIIFPINSTGHLVQCAMVNKIMPSLQYGVNIISFLLNSKLSKQNLIIYDQRTGLVDSMSEKAEGLLMGKKSKKNSISIPDHISDILPIWDYVKEQTIELSKKSTKQLQFSYNNVHLYRSDGPTDNKFVKVITFDLTFQSKIFTMNECLTQSSNFWLGFQTLVENSPIMKERERELTRIEEHKRKEQEQMNDATEVAKVSPKEQIEKPVQRPTNAPSSKKRSMFVEDVTLYSPLSSWFPKLYLTIQILILLTIAGLIIFSYVNTIGYYKVLENDIVIKENIADVLDIMLQDTEQASEFLYANGDPIILKEVNNEEAKDELKEIISLGQWVYQEMIKKVKLNELQMSDLQMEVSYFVNPTTAIIKQQTVTDASYQMVLYLLEIYNNDNPLINLPNNILFVFRNCLNIADKLDELNEIFTKNLMTNSEKRKSQSLRIVLAILGIFAFGLLWETIYKLLIGVKINQVISIYEAIPIPELQKYPTKCQNFVKYVCPVQVSKNLITTTVRSIRHLGSALNNEIMKKQYQQSNDDVSLLEEEEEVQFVTFSAGFGLMGIVLQSIGFLLIFGVLFVVGVTSESSLLTKNLEEVGYWNNLAKFHTELLKSTYLLNEYKNRGKQWNSTQLLQIDTEFNQTIVNIERYLKTTPQLNSYLSLSYQLIQQSVYIITRDDISTEHQMLNKNRMFQLAEAVLQNQIDGQIQYNMAKTISSFLSMLQLVLIGQITLFILFAIVYIPKSYKDYVQKKQINQMMYQTLGYRLQTIAKTNIDNK